MFKQKTAIISGGLGDIGQAIALELARGGANIALSDIRAESDADAILAQLRGLGVSCRYDAVDVTDAAAVEQWVVRVERELDTATLIVPNAAIVTTKNILEITAEQWSRELRINLDGAFHMAQSATKRIIAKQLPGRIVFVGSWAGHAPHVRMPAYCVAKAGMRMLCQCMALQLAEQNVLVNEIAPGYVDAGLSGKMYDKNPALRETSRQKVPVQQLITAQEVAQQVAYLCDPKNRHITGTTLLMDGGLSLKR